MEVCVCVWVGCWDWSRPSRKTATICVMNTSRQPVCTTHAGMKGWLVGRETAGNSDKAEVKVESHPNHAWALPSTGLVTLSWENDLAGKIRPLFSSFTCHSWPRSGCSFPLPWGPTASWESDPDHQWPLELKCSHTWYCGPPQHSQALPTSLPVLCLLFLFFPSHLFFAMVTLNNFK